MAQAAAFWRISAVTLLLGLLGCTGGPRGPAPVDSAPRDDGEPWLCQPGAQEAWDCIRSRELPERPPQVRPPTPEPATEPPPFSTPAPPEAPNGASPPPPATGREAAEAPAYQRLAYQAESPVALQDLPPDFYAVQLMAMNTAEELEAYAHEQGLQGMSAAQVERDGKVFYVLLLGIYETRQDAEAATADMPASFAGTTPWIRRLGSLQAAMLRADSPAN